MKNALIIILIVMVAISILYVRELTTERNWYHYEATSCIKEVERIQEDIEKLQREYITNSRSGRVLIPGDINNE